MPAEAPTTPEAASDNSQPAGAGRSVFRLQARYALRHCTTMQGKYPSRRRSAVGWRSWPCLGGCSRQSSDDFGAIPRSCLCLGQSDRQRRRAIAGWSAKTHKTFSWRRSRSSCWIDRTLEKGERVVDIGCGCGATTIELARRVGPTGYVLGMDILGAHARPGARACAGGLTFRVRACRCHGARVRAWAQRSPVLSLWRHVLRRPGAFICQHAQGAAGWRPPGVRLLARAAQQPMDDGCAAGSVQTRSAPAGSRA